MKVLVLSAFIAAVLLPSVSAYACYKCAKNDEKCENFSLTKLVTISTCDTKEGETCGKKIFEDDEGKVTVERGCFKNDDKDEGCEDDDDVKTCYCLHDRCNAGMRVFLPKSLIVVTSAAAVIKLIAGSVL